MRSPAHGLGGFCRHPHGSSGVMSLRGPPSRTLNLGPMLLPRCRDSASAGGAYARIEGWLDQLRAAGLTARGAPRFPARCGAASMFHVSVGTRGLQTTTTLGKECGIKFFDLQK